MTLDWSRVWKTKKVSAVFARQVVQLLEVRVGLKGEWETDKNYRKQMKCVRNQQLGAYAHMC